jgi:hypothetical protein
LERARSQEHLHEVAKRDAWFARVEVRQEVAVYEPLEQLFRVPTVEPNGDHP